jgi:alanine dehydrogenase
MMQDLNLLHGLNIHQGNITYEAVARELNFDYLPAKEAISH